MAYNLSFGTPEGINFFNKELTKTLEIYDKVAQRYIKFDPSTGEVLSGKFVADSGQSIVYESYGKISVPSVLTESEQASYAVEFVTKGAGLFSDFKAATGINIQRATDDVILSKVNSWQGKGDYMGVDNWEVFEIPAGTKLYEGLPGQAEFYSTLENLEKVGYDKVKFWESLQVKANPTYGYRPKVGEYVIKKNIKVAISKTTANSTYGTGGGWQIFVDDFINDVEFIKESPLK